MKVKELETSLAEKASQKKGNAKTDEETNLSEGAE